ncbi:MAG TPA: transcription antitermination factor NusB [Phycisphaerales bacterium]|nr:transcription antitermination factor NusB [Phycisphaerales bacterium]
MPNDKRPRKPSLRGGGKPGRKDRSDRASRPARDGRPSAFSSARGERPSPVRRRATDPAREVVFRAIARQAKAWPDFDIEGLPEEAMAGLSALDAAFAHAIYDAVIRRWLTLKHLLGTCLRVEYEKIEPRTLSALMCGAAQCLFMDKVPAHAATNESVNWVKSVAGDRAGGMVNAVMRKLLSLAPEGGASRREAWSDKRDELPMADGTAITFREVVFPEDPMQRLAAATSCPVELLRTLSKSMPMREARKIALHGLLHPPIVLNTAHAQAELPAAVLPHNVPGHHVYTGTHEELRTILSSRKDIWVQDPGSSLAVSSVTDLSPSLIVDPCAGLGTKTRQLAATFPNAKIIATDVDLPRRQTLAGVFAGHDRVTVIDYERLLDWVGKADLVLLDVPCSNTGVLARRVEARYRYSAKRTAELVSTQRQIIADSLRLLATGRNRGKILYSTCSLDPEENEEQARWAVRWHSFALSRESRRLPEGQPGEGPERYTDGSYAVLLA